MADERERMVQLSWSDDDGHYDSIDAEVPDSELETLIDRFLALNAARVATAIRTTPGLTFPTCGIAYEEGSHIHADARCWMTIEADRG